MGEGEGTHMEGWGTYVSKDHSDAYGYAYREKRKRMPAGGEDLEWRLEEARKAVIGAENIVNEWSEIAKTNETGKEFLQKFQKTLEERSQAYEELRREYDELTGGDHPHGYLYTVRIPDDTGENYLHWDAKLDARTGSRIGLTPEEIQDITEVKEGKEIFYDFFSNWKVKRKKESSENPVVISSSDRETQLSARDSALDSAAKVRRNSETGKGGSQFSVETGDESGREAPATEAERRREELAELRGAIFGRHGQLGVDYARVKTIYDLGSELLARGATRASRGFRRGRRGRGGGG